MSKALLVVNPSSGGEKAKDFEALATKKLQSLFDEVLVKHTEKGGDATMFVKEAAENRFDSVFVMGGDGTVNEGISGLAEQAYRPTFGFFPLGTVNDLARALNISLDPAEAIESLDISLVKTLDIGKINDKYFMNVVGIGTIPEAINNVESEEKTKWGSLAYFFFGFKKFMNNTSYPFILTIDGQEREITSSTILIGSTNSIGGFEGLLPDAEVNDGMLHMIYIKDESLIDTIKAVPSLLSGVDESTASVEYITFKEAEIALKNAEDSLRVNVDGDEGDALPVKVSVLPSHLNVYYRQPKED